MLARIGPLLVVVACVVGACKAKVPDRAAAATCASDNDCTFFCASKGDCCHHPYCETPALATEARAIDEYNSAHCTADDRAKCPRIGAAVDPGYTVAVKCRAGSCVAEKSTIDASRPAPAPTAAPSSPKVVDVSAYDLSCKAKSDCAVVKAAPCDKCACASAPIAVKDKPRFDAAAGAIDCKGIKDDRACGECRGSVPDCVAGKCVAVPER